MTESEYLRDFELVKDEVNIAMWSFYTHLNILNYAAEDKTVFRKLNEHPTYWNVQLHSFQTTFFISLGRIFDDGKDTHSIHKLIAATVEHPEFFSVKALEKRKTAGGKKPDWLESYLEEAFEPRVADLRLLKKELAKYKKKFSAVYKDIRNLVFAHKILKDKEKVTELFGKTQVGEIEDMLYFLHDLLENIWQLFQNGLRPDLGVRTYEYKEKIQKTTRSVLGSIVSSTKQEA